MTTQPQIEPVTDEDTRVAMQSYFINMKQILAEDRRRVAERQVLTHETNLRLLDTAYAEIEHLRAENTSLRTLIAVQPTPCVYCGLTEMAKCASGFPGCARADDLICGEDEAFKAVVSERNSLRAEVAKLRAACAAMQERCARACEDEARIWEADGKGPECAARLCAARIRSLPNVTDAGKGWIDATGAVETGVFWYSGRYVVEIPKSMALSRVLIVPVKQ